MNSYHDCRSSSSGLLLLGSMEDGGGGPGEVGSKRVGGAVVVGTIVE